MNLSMLDTVGVMHVCGIHLQVPSRLSQLGKFLNSSVCVIERFVQDLKRKKKFNPLVPKASWVRVCLRVCYIDGEVREQRQNRTTRNSTAAACSHIQHTCTRIARLPD